MLKSCDPVAAWCRAGHREIVDELINFEIKGVKLSNSDNAIIQNNLTLKDNYPNNELNVFPKIPMIHNELYICKQKCLSVPKRQI